MVIKYYRILILLVMFFLGDNNIHSQNVKCNIPIRIDILNVGWAEFSFENINEAGTDTIIRYDQKRNENLTTILELANCKGQLKFTQYISKSHISICEGNYISCPDTLKTLIGIVDPVPPFKINYIVQPYFEAIRNGVWKFYSNSGTLTEQHKYDNGWMEELIKY